MKTANFSFLFLVLMVTVVHPSFGQRWSRRTATAQVNTLAGTSWKVDGIPFADKDRSAYAFTGYDPMNFDDHWGHFISFDEKTFTSSYSAPCGNDCFTSVSGEYWFKSETRIHIKVLKIERNGYCDKGSESVNRDYGFFDLTKADNGWKLTKVD